MNNNNSNIVENSNFYTGQEEEEGEAKFYVLKVLQRLLRKSMLKESKNKIFMIKTKINFKFLIQVFIISLMIGIGGFDK